MMIKKSKKRIALFLCLSLIILSVASPVVADPEKSVKAKTVTINLASNFTMYIGSSKTIKVKGMKQNDAAKKVIYKSDAPDVVKVSSKGNMKALKAGKAVITITLADSKKAEKKVKVTVKNLVKNASQNKVQLSLDKKQSLQLSLAVKASYLSFHSSRSSVAAVNGKGIVRAKKEGTTKITIKGIKGKAKGAKQVITVSVVKTSVKPTEPAKPAETMQPAATTKPTETIQPTATTKPVETEAPTIVSTFQTVKEMKTADLKAGDFVQTKGYWNAGDNGAAVYEIMTYEEWYSRLPKDILYVRPENTLIKTPVDEYGNHTLDNGLVAGLYGNTYTPEQWGAKDGANLMPFIHMFAQVKTGRIDFAQDKTYELELIAKDNPYRTYMCGALLGGQYFYKPIMGNVHDLVLDGHNCTITVPEGKFGDSGMGILNFTQDIVNLEVKNFNLDGKGHTMFWENKNSNHLIFYAPGALYVNTMGEIGTQHWRYDASVNPDSPNESFRRSKIENWNIHNNTFQNAGAMYSKAGDFGGDCILVINPDALDGLHIDDNEFYNWGRWVFAIDLGGNGERLYNISFNRNKCIGANGYLEVNEDGSYRYLNEAPQMVGSVDTWRWRALGLIDFESKKCFTNVEMKDNYILGTGGWAINGNSKVSENIRIENNYWNHVGGGYPYRFEFYSGIAKDIVFKNNEMLGNGGCKLGIFTHNADIENNVFNGAFRTFGIAGDIIFKGNRKTSTISTLWSHEANVFYDDYLSYDKVKNEVGTHVVYKDNDGYLHGIFTDMKDIDKLSYINMDIDTDTHKIYKMGITAFGTNLKINPESFTSTPQDMYAHGAEITKPFNSTSGLGSIVKVKAGQTVVTNMQEGYGVIGGYFFKNMTGIEDFAKYNNCNWGTYASWNKIKKIDLVCTQDGYLPGTCEYGFRYQGTHISYVLDKNLTLQDHAYVYTDDNLYYTEKGGKLTKVPTHTSGSMMDGETELVYIGKVAKVKLVTSNELK